MPVHKVVSNELVVQVWRDANEDNAVTVLLADLVSDTRVGKEAEIKAKVQEGLDLRIAKTDLPADDPDRTTNPDRINESWDGDVLLTREVLVVDVVWHVERAAYLPELKVNK